MERLVFATIANGIALWVADRFVSGFSVSGTFWDFALAAFILALLHIFLRPILKLIGGPFIIITLGLFLVVINAALLWLLDHLFDTITISGIIPLLASTVIVSLIGMVVSSSRKKKTTT